MPELMFHFYLMAVGFVLAGLTQTGFQLMTGRTLRFAMERSEGPLFVPNLLARVVAGPVILMRNGVLLAQHEGRAPHWLAVTTAIAGLWSFLSGAVFVAMFA